mgnify:FL=1
MKLQQTIFDFFHKRQPKREVIMHRWEDVRSVAIISDNSTIDHIVHTITKDARSVDVFLLPNKKDVCTLTGRPKSAIREALTARQYDLLIDLTQQPSITLQYMAMYVRADFKTGRHICDGIHDMTIDTPAQSTPDYLFEQIVRYINMFTQK